MGSSYTKISADAIRENLHSGGYAQKWHAVGAVKRSSIIEAERQKLLAEIEVYFHNRDASTNGKKRGRPPTQRAAAPAVVKRGPRTPRAKSAPSYQTLAQELEALEARKREVLALMEASKLQELITADPSRIRQALALLEEVEREESAKLDAYAREERAKLDAYEREDRAGDDSAPRPIAQWESQS